MVGELTWHVKVCYVLSLPLCLDHPFLAHALLMPAYQTLPEWIWMLLIRGEGE